MLYFAKFTNTHRKNNYVLRKNGNQKLKAIKASNNSLTACYTLRVFRVFLNIV